MKFGFADDLHCDTMGSTEENHVATQPKELHAPAWFNVIALLVSLLAGVVAFLPFAVNTSAWDAVTLRVPGNQGNWWHALVGLPFFLAFPMIWLCVRWLFSMQLYPAGRRLIWSLVGLSICGTILVELPFLLHRAGTSESQRLLIIATGFGTIIAGAALLFRRRHNISPDRACFIGLNTAYLANAALCLIVYSAMAGTIRSRLGWLVTIVIVWPMVMELLWIFIQTPETQTMPSKTTV